MIATVNSCEPNLIYERQEACGGPHFHHWDSLSAGICTILVLISILEIYQNPIITTTFTPLLYTYLEIERRVRKPQSGFKPA